MAEETDVDETTPPSKKVKVGTNRYKGQPLRRTVGS